MAKTAIVYRSPHHGNTKKLIDAIQAANPAVALIQAGEEVFSPDAYDVIGFASGIYAGRLHRTVRKVMDSLNGKGRKAFLLYTCGDKEGGKYAARYESALQEKGFTVLGHYWCPGWDSFGPLKLVGGILKDRPNADDIKGAVRFFAGIAG